MVFRYVHVIHGIRLNDEQIELVLKKYYGLNPREIMQQEGMTMDDVVSEYVPGGSHLKIFSTPGHKKTRYILGRKRRSYVRKIVRCTDCPGEHLFCENCIKETENGPYDVERIASRPQKLMHACGNCFHDNREAYTKCSACNVEPICEPTLTASFEPSLRKLVKLVEKKKIPKYFKAYLMLDDCTCCT